MYRRDRHCRTAKTVNLVHRLKAPKCDNAGERHTASAPIPVPGWWLRELAPPCNQPCPNKDLQAFSVAAGAKTGREHAGPRGLLSARSAFRFRIEKERVSDDDAWAAYVRVHPAQRKMGRASLRQHPGSASRGAVVSRAGRPVGKGPLPEPGRARGGPGGGQGSELVLNRIPDFKGAVGKTANELILMRVVVLAGGILPELGGCFAGVVVVVDDHEEKMPGARQLVRDERGLHDRKESAASGPGPGSVTLPAGSTKTRTMNPHSTSMEIHRA